MAYNSESWINDIKLQTQQLFAHFNIFYYIFVQLIVKTIAKINILENLFLF